MIGLRANREASLEGSKERARLLLLKPGCIFCREELARQRKYWSWFLLEHYSEQPLIVRLQQSHGFCQRHTRHLLACARPHHLEVVYHYLIPPALREIEGLKDTTSMSSASRLKPDLSCPACSQEADLLRRELFFLCGGLNDHEIQQRVIDHSAICRYHFVEFAGSLSWSHLRTLGEAAACWVPTPGVAPASDGESEHTTWAWLHGCDRDRDLRAQGGEEADMDGIQPRGQQAGNAPSVPGSSWSLTVQELQELLVQGGCPLCLARGEALLAYVDWLGDEILQEQGQWDDALWLCRTHSWDFVARVGGAALFRLTDAMDGYWRAQLRSLLNGLATEPSGFLPARLGEVPGHLRRLRSPQEQPLKLRWALLAALHLAAERPSSRLAALRNRTLQTRECPACRHLQTTTLRLSHLLARALEDPSTARVYQESHGVCLRDLPWVLAGDRSSGKTDTLLKAQRVRLEILYWELEEAQRKQNWSVRYEARRSERSAWYRAVSHFTGSRLTDGTVIGTT